MWDHGATPGGLVRLLGPWGPRLLERYARSRYRQGYHLTPEEADRLGPYAYHILAGGPAAVGLLVKVERKGSLWEAYRNGTCSCLCVYVVWGWCGSQRSRHQWSVDRGGPRYQGLLPAAHCAPVPSPPHPPRAARGSGEFALRHLLAPFAWPRLAIEDRADQLTVPVTFIYGEHCSNGTRATATALQQRHCRVQQPG